MKQRNFALVMPGHTVLTNNEETLYRLFQHMRIAKEVCQEAHDRG